MKKRVVVIGAGMIGAASAYECIRAGHEVTIVEPENPGGEQAASYGNGCWISNTSMLPMSTPGLWRQVPGFLMDPLGPFTIRWRYLPKLLPWLIKFVLAGSNLKKVEATVKARFALTANTVDQHMAMAKETGVSELIVNSGLIHVYPDKAEYLRTALDWRTRREYGLKWTELEGEELKKFEPGIGSDYTFGCYMPEAANLTDPGAYVDAIVKYAVSKGAKIVRERATGFDIRDGRLQGVKTQTSTIPCDKALICAGIWSSELARQAGDHIPLETERGYHVVIENPEYVPHHPLMPSDGKMAITMTRAGLRVAGQVEMGGIAAKQNWKRADILLAHLTRLFPAVPRHPEPSRLKMWMGHRPSTPDGLPSLGPASGCADVIHGFGHGHSGMGMGPGSAKLLAAFVSGVAPNIDPKPYAPQRFS